MFLESLLWKHSKYPKLVDIDLTCDMLGAKCDFNE